MRKTRIKAARRGLIAAAEELKAAAYAPDVYYGDLGKVASEVDLVLAALDTYHKAKASK